MSADMTPVAIVGMSCRLPGDVATLDDFWLLMSRARSGWGEIPKDRFSKDAYWHPNPEKKGCFNSAGGYFLKHDIAKFDAPFFNMTKQEAQAMDPQQRQLLECTYEAMENAGIPKETIAGRNMGVFVGSSPSDYQQGSMRDLDTVPMFDETGNHQSIHAGRIAHYFDLKGPCFAVDTACSSGLHAVHLAVQSIRSGETKQAVVASSRLNLQPDHVVSLSTNRLLSEHGVTYSFDDRAKSGFARGEGTGCLILKPLDKAIEDNDKIWSVIVNTGVNQDGRTPGITSPSADAQERLIREVYAKAGISTKDTAFIEAHGTGTKVGDPIEADAIHRVFGQDLTARRPLYIGSVKSNVGHLEPASGIIAIIKSAMMLEKGFILPNANFNQANENIPLAKWNMKVPTSIRPWPKDKRYVSINNFGFGGSNAHCVLEKSFVAPLRNLVQAPAAQRLFVLSAHDEESATQRARQLGVYLEQHPGVFEKQLVRNIAYTLCKRRSQLSWRTALVGSTTADLTQALNGTEAKSVRALRNVKIGFVFTGQGAQWHAMGRELMNSHDVFASSIRAADETLQRLGASFSLFQELSRDKETSQINQAHISQPCCTAVQVALVDLLRSWGVTPKCVVGHSSGEIAAAYAAGAISLENALSAAYHRGCAVLEMQTQHSHHVGAMLAVGCGKGVVAPMIKKLQSGQCTIACENSPSSLTISGDEAAIDELASEIEKAAIFNRKLKVDVAYHSTHMESVADFYLNTIKDLPASPTDVSFYSSLNGELLKDTSALSASYWVRNLTNPVLFSTALEKLCKGSEPDVLVEIGPHSALDGPIKQIMKSLGDQARKIAYLPSLKRNEDATLTMLTLAGNLFKKGANLDFDQVNPDVISPRPNHISNFAPYPWTGQTYWRESRVSRQHRLKPFPRHDLLGSLISMASDHEPSWRNVLRTDDIPWLRDHKMQELTAFPFSGFVSMAVEAVSQRAMMLGVDFDQFTLREMQVTRPFLLQDGEEYETICNLRQFSEGTRSYSDKWDEFRVHSYHADRGWTEHCRGLIAVTKRPASNPVCGSPVDEAAANIVAKARETCGTVVPTASFYGELRDRGAGYGPTLQNILNLSACDDYMSGIGKVVVPDTAATMPEQYQTETLINAAFLDILFQHTFVVLGAGRGTMPCLYMPSSVKEIQLNRLVPSEAGEPFEVFVNGHTDLSTPKPVEVMIQAFDRLNPTEPAIMIKGFEVSPVKGDSFGSSEMKQLCYKMDWGPLKLEDQSADVKPIQTNGVQANGVTPDYSLWRDASVVLITDRSGEDFFVKCLADLLELRTGQIPIISSLEAADVVDKLCINLCEVDNSLLAGPTTKAFDKIQETLLGCSSYLWVTSGAYKNAQYPHRNMAQGLSRTVRSETGKQVFTLDLDPVAESLGHEQADLIVQVVQHVLDSHALNAPDMEFAEEDGKLVVPRIVEDAEMNTFVQRETQESGPYAQEFHQPERRLKLDIERPGALDSIYFMDDEYTPLEKDEIEISVEATGMNFKDVVICMGQLASPYIGVECSGTVARIGPGVTSLCVGDRVCAMPVGAYRTFARCLASSAAKMPEDMAMEVGASIPVAYCTAYYALFEIARLSEGERVLIHAAAGGVGQAAIQLAQTVKAEIFATVGSVDKKQLIVDKYGIPEDHIFYSRNTSFGPAIRNMTGGEGVDVVINSLAGELLRETWDCIAHFGRFIEIGKRDITNNTRLEMRRFESNALFSSVDLTVLAAERPKIMGRVMKAVMAAMDKKEIGPIYPVTVMGISDIEKALRLLQGGRTTGKLVISHSQGGQVKATHPRTSKQIFSGDASYMILGGTGGLGRSVAKWMVQKGAGSVVLVSRSGTNNMVNKLIEDLGPLGSRIEVRACDITDAASLDAVVKECSQSLPPVRGVLHATMVLRDMLYEKMSFEDFNAVVQSKVAGAWNIHNSLAGVELDFFVVLSSIAGIIGNKGQAAYAAANTFLDGLVRHRKQQGLPSVAIDLPAMDDVGYLAENSERRDVVLGTLKGNTATEAELLALLKAAVQGASGDLSGQQILTGLHVSDSSRPPYSIHDARFAALLTAGGDTTDGGSAQSLSVKQVVSTASTAQEAEEAVIGGLIEKLSSILLVPLEDLDPGSSVTSYGLDSLNAIELRNWISKELLAHLQVLELLTSDTLRKLATLILVKSRIERTFTMEA